TDAGRTGDVRSSNIAPDRLDERRDLDVLCPIRDRLRPDAQGSAGVELRAGRHDGNRVLCDVRRDARLGLAARGGLRLRTRDLGCDVDGRRGMGLSRAPAAALLDAA